MSQLEIVVEMFMNAVRDGMLKGMTLVREIDRYLRD